ncbi:MAG TPA: prolyl oligopeptidase family serine peptidase [Gemmatimonadaceae bacterium]|nr:prolyl oligopeptidase family serine peptidase [Gemmatimonadaceae bacterium]
MSLRLLARGVVLAAAYPAALSAQQLTLDQVMSAPFSSDLVAAPKGGAVAWIGVTRGVRNVWVARAPGWEGRQVTSYSDDDGQEIEGLSFSADGRNLVFVRGGASNRGGERPNPALIPGGVDQSVWVASIEGGALRKISEGSSPEVSPTGDTVAFVRGGQIWIARLRGGDESRVEQIAKLRGGPSSLRWSPDGRRLAFTSNRQRHSFIGVWDFGSQSLRYVDPSTDEDGGPVWSPDGNALAFIRTPSTISDLLFVPQRESPIPWSIRVADMNTGRSREVWRARAGAGSVFREIVSVDQLFWSASGDRIAFPWEADGWTHLYSVATTGSGSATAHLLTPGNFEVEYVSASPDGRTLVYNSNENDVDRRHIWSVSIDPTSRPIQLTRGTGIEWNPVMSGTSVLVLRSDARLPGRAAILDAHALRDLAPSLISADFPAAALVEPQVVMLRAADGTPVHAQVFLPHDGASKHPAAVFFHGGSRRQMLLGWHYMYYYANAYAMNQYLASRGYVVLSVNYRSGIGYGMGFREALNYGASGASEYQDVVAAGRYLRGRSDVDARRIGLWGGSYGGFLTAMGLARNSDMFAAGVDIHGVHDWNTEIPNFVPAYDSLRYATESALAYRSSPLAFISGWRSPVLLIHGDDDRNVPFNESVKLAYELRRRGITVEQLIFPDDVHDFLLWRNWVSAYRATDDFFGRKLRGAAAVSATAP